jgi:hypothetical protein
MGKPTNQGEGNREADRNYREGATEYADTDAQKRAAQDAKRDEEEQEREKE